MKNRPFSACAVPVWLLPVALSCLAGMSAARADDDVTERVLVTGTRAASGWHEQANALSWISSRDLDARRPLGMGDVLNTLPGVFWVDLGNEQHSMSIRLPMSTNAAYLYMEDGIPIRPLGLFNHNALNEVNLNGAGQIEALRGPASSLYGSNAVGGALNFLTAAARENERFVQLRGSDQGYRRVDARVAQTWQGGGVRIGHYTAQVREGWQEHSDMDKATTTLRVDQDLSDSTRVWFTATHSDLQTDMPGGLDTADYVQSPDKSYNRFTWRSDVATRVSGFLLHEFSAQDRAQLAVFARRNSHAQLPSYLIFNTANPRVASGRQNDNRFESLGLDAWWQHRFAALDAEFVAGLYRDRSPNDYQETNLGIDRDPASGRYLAYRVTGLRRDYDVDIANDAFYTQWQGKLANNWLWQVGARHDRISYAFDNHLTPNGTTGPADETRDYARTTPRAGLVWLINDEQSVFFSRAEGFIPPEVSSLYGRLETPNLRESVFTSHELGWRLQREHLRADLTLYRMDGEDELVSYTIAQGLSEPRNAGSTRHQGIEFGLDWAFVKQAGVAVALAHSTHENRQYAVSPTLHYNGLDIKSAPEWLGQVALWWRPQDALLTRLSWIHVDDYWMDDANTRRYPGHDLLQLQVQWRLDNWTVHLQANNLTDERYADSASWASGRASYSPGAPRSVTASLSFTF